MHLKAIPITFKAAQDFITKYHRHHKAPAGSKFIVGMTDESGTLIGVVVCGRPVARACDDGFTSEVTRTCTTGEKNANSFLYGIAHRIAKDMGYKKQITYTQEGESGSSLLASGFKLAATLPPEATGLNLLKSCVQSGTPGLLPPE